MGASSSKKKKNKKGDGFGILGDLADAAEGATSSLTKAIEDTTSAVSNKIEQTTKSVTDVIDTTAKSLTGAAESATVEANKTSESTLVGVTSTVDQLKETANTTELLIDASQKSISDAKKATNATLGTIKSQLEETEDKARQATADISKDVANSTKEATDKIAKRASDIAQNVESSIQKSIEETKNSVECKVDQLKTEAKTKGEELKEAVASAGNTVKGTADSLKSNVDELTEQGAAAVKQLEITGKENLKNLESKTNEAKKSAEATAAELQNTVKDRSNTLINSSEAKANFLKGSAEEFKGQAENQMDELNKSANEKQNQMSSGAEGLKENLGSTVGFMKNTTEGLKTAVSGAVEAAVHTATDAAHKTVEGVGQSLTKANRNVSKSLTGSVGQVSGSVIQAAGTAAIEFMEKASLAGSDLAQGSSELAKMAESTLGRVTADLLPENSVTVCSVNDLKDGEMKVFKVCEDGSILLVKENGMFSALGTKCSHYGAPLAKGVLYNGRVRCPWHGACFNVSTGDIEDSPGLDSLPCYKVTIEDGQVKVHAPAELLKHNMRTKSLCKKDVSDKRTFLIVGGGGSSQACAETLRQEGFTGNLLVLTKEGNAPYDRPKLSKALTSTGKDLALRNEDYFKNGDIELLLHHEVISIDIDAKTLQCSNEKTLSFDKVMIATGGKPITLSVEGHDLENICYLRTPADANKIADLARDKNAVVVGTSFIGLEVASYLQGKSKSVTVIGRSKTPFAQVFGEQVGQRLMKLCMEKGIVFYMETQVEAFFGKEDNLCAVKLTDGQEVPAEVCVVGIGVKPATDFLKGGKVPLNEKGFIPVNQEMRTGIQDVFGAGDIVEFPLPLFGEDKATIGHWQMAQTQGRQAALSMLGKKALVETCPFFWCSMFGKSLRYAGYGHGADDFIIDGDLEAMKFVLYICRGDRVIAVTTMGYDPVASNYASFVCSGKILTKTEIQSDPKAWLSLTC